MVGFDWTVAGFERPLTAEEAEQVAAGRSGNEECTLEPRDRGDAEQLLRFGVKDASHAVRLSSHLLAWTSLGEIIVVDVLAGDSLLESRAISRWRGDF